MNEKRFEQRDWQIEAAKEVSWSLVGHKLIISKGVMNFAFSIHFLFLGEKVKDIFYTEIIQFF